MPESGLPTIAVNQAENFLPQVFVPEQATCLYAPRPSHGHFAPFQAGTTEPRDLSPVDKTRASHIVDRVLALDLEAAVSQLTEVLKSFEPRHRNLMVIIGARANEMEDAFAPHARSASRE